MWPEQIDPAALKARNLVDVGHLASNLLREGGVSGPPTPQNLVALLEPGRSVIVERRSLPRGLHGQIVPDRLGWTILLNESDHPRAQRLSLYHEAFHILRRSRGLFGDEDYRYLEWLANAFAYRVLMPRDWLATALKQTADTRRLATLFFVPLTAMRARLKELGR